MDRHGFVDFHKHIAFQPEGEYLELPCGKCAACKAKNVRSWAIRAHHEAVTTTRKVRTGSGTAEIPHGCFLTLTYAPEHLPPDNSLNHAHFQNFMKALRRNNTKKIRYLMCGEYGSEEHTNRPHYHALLFGKDFHRDRKVHRKTEDTTEWISEELTDTWGKGHCTLSPLNFATASYVAGYTFKKLNANHEEHARAIYGAGIFPIAYELQTRKPEYIAMSRRKGLGTDWFEKYWPEVYPRDSVIINGKEFPPPTFYDKLLAASQPCLYDQVIAQRREYLESLGPTGRQQLRSRRLNFEAKFATKNKRDKI